MSEPPLSPQHPSNIPVQISPNAAALTSTVPHVPRTSEDILLIDPQLLNKSGESPVQTPMDLPDTSNALVPAEVFELFCDALEQLVDTNDDTLLMVTSTSTNEAADALYSCLW